MTLPEPPNKVKGADLIDRNSRFYAVTDKLDKILDDPDIPEVIKFSIGAWIKAELPDVKKRQNEFARLNDMSSPHTV